MEITGSKNIIGERIMRKDKDMVHLDNDLDQNLAIEEEQATRVLVMAITLIVCGIAFIVAVVKFAAWLLE